MDDAEKIDKMKSALKYYCRRRNFLNCVKPQLLLNSTSLNIAYILCLNYREVSLFQYKYLRMWSNQTNPYINANDFVCKLGLNSSVFFDNFFNIYDSKVDFNVFLIFIYGFVFAPFEHLVRLLLCACGINPNVGISNNQLIRFLSYFQTDGIATFTISDTTGQNGIYVDNICEILKSNSYSTSFLYDIKKNLVKEIISTELYLEITNRVRIFKDLDLHVLGINRVETKCEHLNRVLFTHKSCPYESDYRNLLNEQNPDSRQIISIFNVLCDICRLYPIEEDKKKSYKENRENSGSFISLNKENTRERNRNIVSHASNSS